MARLADALRAEGQRGARAVVVAAAVPRAGAAETQVISRRPAGPVSASPGSSLPGPEWPQWVAPPGPGVTARGPWQVSGRTVQRGAPSLRFQPVEAKLPGFPGPAFVRRPGRQACVPAPARVSGCARSPLMRPSARPAAGNNAQKPAVWPAPTALTAWAALCAQGRRPSRAQTSCASS